MLIKRISEKLKNEAKGGFLPMLLIALAASMLGNAFSGRGIIRAG